MGNDKDKSRVVDDGTSGGTRVRTRGRVETTVRTRGRVEELDSLLDGMKDIDLDKEGVVDGEDKARPNDLMYAVVFALFCVITMVITGAYSQA